MTDHVEVLRELEKEWRERADDIAYGATERAASESAGIRRCADELQAAIAALSVGEWKWYGIAAHFIGSGSCLFHMATEVGGYMVSTVGDYRPFNAGGERGNRERIGCDRDYETFVFRTTGERCECGCGQPIFNLSEIDSEPANDAATANANHMAMCAKYSAFSTSKDPTP